jgi:uroporphyrinogen decarboxylase
MNARERFLTAARCQPTDRPPIWIMRQAGRYLPEYRALKAQHSFHQLVMTPELACEVTMQPLRRYALDAAILFSDILVIPEALGQPYHFRDSGGIEMEFALRGEEDLARLDPRGVRDKLKYVADAIRLIRKNELIADHRALLGFGGSPWTLATYMIEGQSSKEYTTSREWFYTKRDLFDALLEKITKALIEYFYMQIEAGVDAIQIFDSWGGVLAPAAFKTASVDWMKRIIDALPKDFPVIVFSKGMHDHAPLLATTGAHLLGVDWTADLPRVRDSLPHNVGVQGNLDPVLLNTTPDVVEQEARNLLESMRGRTGFVFNLGHGILPTAKPDNVARLVDTVTSWS